MDRFAVSTLGKFLVTQEEGHDAFMAISPQVAKLKKKVTNSFLIFRESLS